MKILYVSWWASNKKQRGHLFWITSSLLGYCGEAEFSTATLKTAKIQGSHNVLNPAAYQRGFGFQNESVARTEADVLAKIVREEEIDVVVIYEGAVFELEVARSLSIVAKNTKVIVNLYEAERWAQFFIQSSVDTLESFKRSYFDVQNMLVSAETRNLSALAKANLNLRIPVFPVFSTLDFQLVSIDDPTALWTRKRQPNSVCVSIGSVNHFEFATALISRLQKEPDVSHIKVILQDRSGHSRHHVGILRQLGLAPDDIFSGVLSPESYAFALLSSSLVLFTYNKENYAYKSSGRVQDALMMGCLPIVQKDTALSGQVRQSGNMVTHEYVRGDVDSAVQSIKRGLAFDCSDISHLSVDDFVNWIKGLQMGQENWSKDPSPKEPFRLSNVASKHVSLRQRIGEQMVRLGLISP